MAEYRVVCVERRPAAGHQHVTGVGVTRGKRALELKSVTEVRRAIKTKKDIFYMVDSSSGEKLVVKRHKCCGEKTIRSPADDKLTDNLAALSSCDRLTWYMIP